MKGAWITYSPEELAWIEARHHLARREMHAEFVAEFGRADVTQANLTALCKRKGWLTGRTGHFQPGHVTDNGNRGKPAHPNAAKHLFKRGQIPHTWRGAGHERIDTKGGYIVMIVAETNPWTGAATRPVLKHKYLWEQVNGPLPKGTALKCLDGNRTNTDPSNWVAIPRAMLPRLNGRFGRGFDAAPPELKQTILQIARLEHAAREARKAKKEARP